MRRFLLWLCSRGMHRGDMILSNRGLLSTDCRTCGETVHRRIW